MNLTPKTPAEKDVQRFERAVMDADLQTMTEMLDKGFPVNAGLVRNEPALILACRGGMEPVARLLIERDADINIVVKPGMLTALQYASITLPDLAIEMMEKGADPTLYMTEQLSVPLINAIEHGHDKLLEYMLEKKVPTNVTRHKRLSPCMTAAIFTPDMLRTLVDHGVDPDWAPYLGTSATHELIDHAPSEIGNIGKLHALLRLVAAGASINGSNGDHSLLPTHVRMRCPDIADTVERVYRAKHYTEKNIGKVTREALLEEKHSLRDNPKTWWNFGEVLSSLEEKGESLSVEELQAKPNSPTGDDYLAFAIRCGGLRCIQEQFSARENPINISHLVKENGKPTDVLHAIMDNDDTHQLLSDSFYRAHSSVELRRFFSALDEDICESLPVNQILHWRSRLESHESRSR